MRVRISGIAYASLFACLLIVTFMTPAAGAQTETGYKASEPVIAEPAAVRVALAPDTKSVPSAFQEARNINLDFHAAEISDVLKALSMQAGANIVTGTDVKGQVTVTLSKVSFKEALDMITRISGYRYAMVGPDTYAVGSVPGVTGLVGDGASDTVSAAVAVIYTDPDQVGKTLEAQIPGLKSASQSGGKSDQPGPKVIVLTGPKAQVDAAKSLVAQIETSMAGALTRESQGKTTEVYCLKHMDVKTTIAAIAPMFPRLAIAPGPTSGFTETVPSGVTFIQGTGASSGGSGTTGPKEEPHTLLLSGPSEDVANAKGLIATFDVRPKQLLIETRVADITVGAEKRLGLSWSWNDLSLAEGTKPSGAGNGSVQRLPFAADAKLDAMFKDNNAKLLANPTVAALEGKPATIFIGDEVKYVVSIQETLTGPTFQTETASVGVTLRVVARPDTDGYITLAIHPEVSTISAWLTIDKTSISLPQISRRFTDHVIRVKDGEMIVIGGLIRDNEVSNLSKIPLLGDLPFLGNLFRHRQKTKEHSDIAVFIKASVMSD